MASMTVRRRVAVGASCCARERRSIEAPQVGATSPTPGSMRCCNGSRTVGGVAPACETLPARWLPQDAAMTQSRGTLWTVGPSPREWEVFAGMLGEVGLAVLSDVRRFPGPPRHHHGRES